jgi:predicted DCC family thiol-disulfide oxidoreductase YuxK
MRNKPILIFDGDCGFCRVWVRRWKNLTGDRVDYVPSQEAGKEFPDIPPADFQKAVQLMEPDGRRTAGAEAVFRTLTYAGFPGGLRAYEKIPGFSVFSEFAYGVVAGHRPTFSTFTRWLWGNPAELSSYRQTRWIFLRALALIYGIAFWSYGLQIKGLNGSQGILSSQEFLNHLARYGAMKYWYVPSLAWLNSSDSFLVGLCMMGVGVSLLLFFNIAPRSLFFISWALYLSLVSIGGDFMNFQWDALLLETGFLAIFFAPPGFLPQRRGAPSPSRPLVFLLRWLLFRLMFQSALVKWLSGDTLWHHFTALTVHYQTQPLPNPLSWFAHALPFGFQRFSCAMMFVIEGVIPVFLWMPRRPRMVAFWVLVGFQGLILSTGNYAYFNWLAIVLCIPLLDDAALRGWIPSWFQEPTAMPPHLGFAAFSRVGEKVLVAGILFLTVMPFARVLGMHPPGGLEAPVEFLSPLRSFNSYGLFAVMTPDRPEIILEGSNDGKNWLAYEFKYKPGDLSRRPAQVAPYQPRLDWQMWFAALGDYRQNPWFINFCVRILQGSKPVLALLGRNPFPDGPPIFLRATVYQYRFTTPAEHRQTGHWWARDVKGLYCPVLSLRGP